MSAKPRTLFRRLLTRRLVIFLLILAQLVLIILMLLRTTQTRWLNLLLNALSIATALHLLTHHEKSAFKLSLVFIILLFPLFGGVFYLIFHFQTNTIGLRQHIARSEKKGREAYAISGADCDTFCREIPESIKQMQYLQNVPGFPVYRNTETVYFPTGKEMLDAMLSEIRQAKRYIFLEYFIIEEGIMWNSILDALRERADAGVDVRVIYDDLGCLLTLPPCYYKELRSHGIKCAVFNPFRPFLSSIQNNRDHRKIMVIDGKTAFTGGMNMADEYINEKIRFGHWKDNAILLRGDGAWSFTVMFLQMWEALNSLQEHYESYFPKDRVAVAGDGWVQPYTDSPMDRENVGEHVYLQIIEKAQRYLYITTPYLMADDGMISALKLAAKSGVDVRIITPSKPDKKLVHFTTRSYYRDLVGANVKIYEYTAGFIHAKSFVSDDTVATVGTTNLDFRSLYLHFECGTCLYRTSTVAAIKQDFEETLTHCRRILPENCRSNLVVRVLQDICRLFAPLM